MPRKAVKTKEIVERPKTYMKREEAQAACRAAILEVLSDPDIPVPKTRLEVFELAGFTNTHVRKLFTPKEINEIIYDGSVKMRRQAMGLDVAKVDRAMLDEAQGGNTKAAQVVYTHIQGQGEVDDFGLVKSIALVLAERLRETHSAIASRQAINVTPDEVLDGQEV